MISPRLTAAIVVIFLIGVATLAGMYLITDVGPILAHGTSVTHTNGKITSINGTSFTLKTAGGQAIQFQCSGHCLVELSHMHRHLIEKANTDVYFLQNANNTMVAIDVD